MIDELHGALGIATNNVAEYNGLLAALRWAVDHGEREVHIRADSELLVKQMRGEYKVKHPGLQPLYVRARLLVMELGRRPFRARPPRTEQGSGSPVQPRRWTKRSGC